MPFTASHPMAVLPVVGRFRLDTTCLVIGSMAPDFEYFARGEQTGAFAHTLLGIVVWGLPVTIACAVVFHGVIKWPLVAMSPRWFANRVAGFAARPWPVRPLAWTISALIGNATHVGWDTFTHAGGWARWHFLWLNHVVSLPVLGAIPIFRVLQHVSTVIGLAAVSAYLVIALRRARPSAVEPASLAARVAFTACVAAAIAALEYRALAILHSRDPGTLIVAGISGLLAGTLIASVLHHRCGAHVRNRVMHAA